MSTTVSTHDHPLRGLVTGLRARLVEAAGMTVWTMDPPETGELMVELSRAVAQLAELELRVAAHAKSVGVGEVAGATSTASWWAHQTRQAPREAHRRMGLAVALGSRYDLLRTALSAGDVSLDQARVIVHALEALPRDLDPAIRAAAEARLVTDAAVHDPVALRILGLRILDIVAPEVAEAHEAKALADEEARAAQAARFTMSEDGHGQVHGRFTLSTLHGAMLKKALLALAAPKRHTGDSDVDTDCPATQRPPTPLRMGHAFAEYMERYPVDRLPDTGGVAATVVVAMSLDQLTGDTTRSATGSATGSATLDTGDLITASQARRLACEAGIIPAVLGGASVILDLGRKTRFHTGPQRIALGLRDKGCTAEGCDWPPGLCHAHHQTPWALGGHTNVTDGRLLCPRHHTRAHDPAYTTTHLPGGKIAFTRRT